MNEAAPNGEPAKIQASHQLRAGAVPNWPVFGLALVGIALTAYLTLTAWSAESVAGCTEESACEVVLNSHWSMLFGLPTSLWGFLVYCSLAGVAWIKRSDTQWKWAWTISVFAVLYSAYLTTISFIELKAACPYCLSSAALFLVILGTTVYQRPREVSLCPWIMKTATVGLIIVLVLHLHYTGTW